MNLDRLIFPLAVASLIIAVAALFGPEVGLAFAFGTVFCSALRLEAHRRRREEREHRDRMRDAAWRLGESDLR